MMISQKGGKTEWKKKRQRRRENEDLLNRKELKIAKT
jgi:hypothetical protein